YNRHLYSLFFFTSRRRHTRFSRDWSSDVCSSDLEECGRSSGAARVTLLAIETERLELLRAEQQLAAQHDLYQGRVKAYAQIQKRSEERRVGKESRSRR